MLTTDVEWREEVLLNLADFHNGAAFSSKEWAKEGLSIIRIEQINNPESATDCYGGFVFAKNAIDAGDLIFSWSATLKVVIWSHGPGVLNQHLYKVVPKKDINRFLLKHILDFHMDGLAGQSQGSTMKHVTRKELSRYKVNFPVALNIQNKLASILQTLDQTIEKTESLIKKYQQIKAGLMHDLFTRGVTPDGKLRPTREEAPELYQETAIGWIPKEWGLESILELKESLVDGPFGSNLKTEHYVVEPGVRVVRLQNIQAIEYNDGDRAYICEKHAIFLQRNRVFSGDILIAGLGDDKYPVGRACLYPEGVSSAINKADCFRLRCIRDKMINSFLMYFFNTSTIRGQIQKYEQGVTRPRINLGNLNRIFAIKPTIKEQTLIVNKVNVVQMLIKVEISKYEKLKKQKAGLMHDLLTGKVQANINEPEAAHV